MTNQHKGIIGHKPLDTNAVSASAKTNRRESGNPADEQLRISYGVIADVDSQSNRIRVDLISASGSPKRLGSGVDGKGDGIWVSIMQPIPIIHLFFGSLRKNLIVRVFWRGKNSPAADAIAEVVSDITVEEFRSGAQKPRSNELTTGPHDIFTGGVYS